MEERKNKILIADDELDLARATRLILKMSGYDVDETHNGKEALEKINGNVYDVILLDIMMPEMDGIETLKCIREKNISTPVILLTAKSQVEDKVEGLDMGANDYLTKPFNKEELLARIRNQIRQMKYKEKKYELGNVTFDKEKSKIYTDKATLNLSNKECKLIELFANNQEKSFSINEIQERVWEKEKGGNIIVPMYMSYIQDKLSAIDANIKIKCENNEYVMEKML